VLLVETVAAGPLVLIELTFQLSRDIAVPETTTAKE
jgi:hypothetical protein